MNSKVRNKGKFEFDSSYIENCSEIELFIQINGYYQFLEQLKLIKYYHKMNHLYEMQGDLNLANYFKSLESSLLDRIPTEEELKELENTLDFCILQTARFNTGVRDNPNGRIQITANFQNWYYSWVNYMKKMDEESYMLYRKCRYEGKGLENFQLNRPISIVRVEDVLNSQKIKQYKYLITNKNIRQKLA